MRAYHLTSEQYALQSLQHSRLKLALLADMNDPFELLALETRSRLDRDFFRQLKLELHESIGVLCFSRSWRNPVLWSHYADKHRGICLGFDIPDEHALVVDYRTTRLKAELENEDPPKDGLHIATRLITTKFRHWQYEKEVRLIYPLAQVQMENGLYFAPYFPWLTLREVVLGARSELPTSAVQHLLAPLHPIAKVVKARLAFRSFSVVQDRRRSVA